MKMVARKWKIWSNIILVHRKSPPERLIYKISCMWTILLNMNKFNRFLRSIMAKFIFSKFNFNCLFENASKALKLIVELKSHSKILIKCFPNDPHVKCQYHIYVSFSMSLFHFLMVDRESLSKVMRGKSY